MAALTGKRRLQPRRPRHPIDRRLERLARSWPPALALALRSHLAVACAPRRDRRRETEPYWLALPRWLDARFQRAAKRPRFALDEILWGQYCLFLAVRVQDDLFDAQSGALGLVYAADELLVESQRAFSRGGDLPAAAVEDIWRRSLSTTVRAIVEVDELQKRPRGMGREDLAAYARVSEVFKVGASAVCLAFDRPDALAAVSGFADGVAIAAQVLDDFEDLDEDLQRGRRNYVASRLLSGGRGKPTSAAGARGRIASALVWDDAAAGILDDARRSLERAAGAIAPLRIPAASLHLRRLSREIDELDRVAHRARCRLVFEPLVATPEHSGKRSGRRLRTRPR